MYDRGNLCDICPVGDYERESCDCSTVCASRRAAATLADYVGRLEELTTNLRNSIRLPCKVGDKFYLVGYSKSQKEPLSYTIKTIRADTDGNLWLYSNEAIEDNPINVKFYLGKTIFFDLEEAKQALALKQDIYNAAINRANDKMVEGFRESILDSVITEKMDLSKTEVTYMENRSDKDDKTKDTL